MDTPDRPPALRAHVGTFRRLLAGLAIVAAGVIVAAGTPAMLFNKNVWTYGWQAEIDACRGAVDISAHYGVAVIAEHWRCGGSSFPRAGTTITLSGVRAGTYRVGSVVAVLNVTKDGTSKVPRGYGLLYQSCINGSNKTMAFTALTRIGG